MYHFLLVLLLLVAVGLVSLILLQQGKGADMGASLGSGASATLFGSSGSGNFMTRVTSILAALFFIISLILGNLSSGNKKTSQWEDLTAPPSSESHIDASKSTPPAANSDIPK